ncbi:zinc finger protein 214-like [Euwallacea similis]|uniref:zinc finger protein 214-like n=1 Tax=Euwallacea similis TaxID=1736056 RepID=UPI0034508D1A
MEVCRLCLNLLEEKTFSKVSEPYKCIINNVIPEAELDVTANPVICYNCSNLIDELNKFKLRCYDSQQKLLLKGMGKEKLKLTVKEILGNCKKNSTKDQICRTCLGPIDCESFTVLIPSNPDAYLDSMLLMCLPELDLSLSRDPVMCKKCLGYLQKLHQLKRACLDIEEELRCHKLQRGDETVDLCAVVAERLVKKSFDMSGVHVKSEVDDEALMEDEEAGIVVKEEQINVKMEEFLLQAGIGLIRINNGNTIPSQGNNLDQETHTRISGPCDLKCDICDKSFSTLWNMQRHKLNHTGEKRFECPYCQMRYSQKHIMEKHIRSRHTGERPFKCDQCPKTFTAKSNLNSHYKTHQGIRPYTCDICGHTFGQKSNLKKHIIGHSESVRIKEFQCEVCLKWFATKYNLHSHMEIHTGDKPHECDLCGETFRHTMNLKVHKLAHAGKNPYTCTSCGMQFLHHSGLSNHEKTHTGDKPYECPICGKRFVKKSIVASHMTLHTGQKEFECFMCKKKYADKSKLNYHLKKKCLKGMGMSVSVR